MATLWKLRDDARGTRNELQERISLADEARMEEYRNAIRIQAWFRGEKVRAYIRYLNHCALVIQRSYRAHIDRGIYRELVQVKLQEMRQRYYNKMATKIQTQWRGFYVRKFVFNYYARKKYLLALEVRNEVVRQQLNTIALQNREEFEEQIQEAEKHSKDEEARRLHHLISTISQPGIYRSPLKRPQIADREWELTRAKPLSKQERYMLAKEKLDRSLRSGVVDTSSSLEKYAYLPAASEPLPPISTSKVQGPFRDPADVISQRHKLLEPTLRVATSYTSVEDARKLLKDQEWTMRVNEEKFLPFTKSKKKYQALMDANMPHERPDYGTSHFRENNATKTIHKKPFKRFISRIPVFEKLGKTY